MDEDRSTLLATLGELVMYVVVGIAALVLASGPLILAEGVENRRPERASAISGTEP